MVINWIEPDVGGATTVVVVIHFSYHGEVDDVVCVDIEVHTVEGDKVDKGLRQMIDMPYGVGPVVEEEVVDGDKPHYAHGAAGLGVGTAEVDGVVEDFKLAHAIAIGKRGSDGRGGCGVVVEKKVTTSVVVDIIDGLVA